MRAIPNSWGVDPSANGLDWNRMTLIVRHLTVLVSGVFAFAFCAPTHLPAADSGQNTVSRLETFADFAARAEKEFEQAQKRFQSDITNSEAAWHYARACFDLAAFSTNDARKAEIAEKGIAASRQLVAREPALAAAHYYLGMNLGQFADTKRNLAALRMVKEMEREFQAAANLDPHFDHAGPDRNLGLLYWQAPSVISVGSRSKAREHLKHAVELAPDYPENRLNLLEAHLKWGERADARRELNALDVLWPEARKKFTGEAWAASWADWEKRFKAAKVKLPDAKK